MVQATTRVSCTFCGTLTDELCDFCAFVDGVAVPICAHHRFTRSPWNHEIHILCADHERLLHTMRQDWVRDHQVKPLAWEWREIQAEEYAAYLPRPKLS